MTAYRGIIHYQFKPGKEEEGLRFIETEFFRYALECGAREVEVFAVEGNRSYAVSTAVYNDMNAANKFKAFFESHKDKLMQFCLSMPKREILKLRSSSAKGRKAA